MNELFLYDRDNGLFRAILTQSAVIQGRYHVATGNELNSNNLGAYLSDAINGIQGVQQKYPLCLCLPPRSVPDSNDNFRYAFTLFFLTRDKHTGQNRLKGENIDQQVSTHQIWEDWKDMIECARNFIRKLNEVIRKESSGSTKLSSLISPPELQDESRVSGIGNDRANGCRITFTVSTSFTCETPDYTQPITVPDLNIHPLHKH